MTRYAFASWEEREANNELKAGLFGIVRPVLSTTTSLGFIAVISFSLGAMSASGMRDLKSERRFPWLQNCPW